MVILGITGGIGSGKSYISSLLREKMDVPVYDCDAEAKRLICEDEGIVQKLTDLVGTHVYKEGKLQKSMLAEYLFADKNHAQKVNAIVHPTVRKDFRKWVEQQQVEVAAIESAILYESGFNAIVDKVIFVNAPLELRIQRAMKRDGSSRQQVEERISMQHTEEQQKKADYVIENDDAESVALQEALQRILIEITAKQTERQEV
ncbi:MAG: dephospho-CoA kinase [Bacteroidaceae bacterium]|nr:dephospho-CoA kinase [Bacteroidaceae bacterium]